MVGCRCPGMRYELYMGAVDRVDAGATAGPRAATELMLIECCCSHAARNCAAAPSERRCGWLVPPAESVIILL